MRSREVYLILSVGLFFRVCISLWNGFWGPSLGANADASSFHQAAINLFSYPGPINELVELSTTYSTYFSLHPDYAHGYHLLNHFYSYLLATIYFITTGSLFIGSIFSAFIWAASAMILIYFMRLLEVGHSDQFKAMVIYSLWPSSIVLTSVTLREAFELFLVNLAVYFALKCYLKKSIKYGLLLFAVIIVVIKFHVSFVVLGSFIIFALLIMLILRKFTGFSVFKVLLISTFAACITYSAISLYGITITNFRGYSFENGLPAAIEQYLLGGITYGGRTQYILNLEISGMIDLLLFLPKNFLQYLFEPMPWRVSTFSDVLVLLENLLRAGLILKILTGVRHMPAQKRHLVLFTFFCYLILEITWSAGTVNWGTAIRHHVPGMGLLIVTAFACSRIKRDNKNSFYQSRKQSYEAHHGISDNIDTDRCM